MVGTSVITKDTVVGAKSFGDPRINSMHSVGKKRKPMFIVGPIGVKKKIEMLLRGKLESRS